MADPTNTASPAPAGSARTSPHALVVMALILHLLSLFFLYQDNTGWGMLTDMTNTDVYTGSYMVFGKDAATGFRVKPLAVFVIGGLLACWAGPFRWAVLTRDGAFWRRRGYLITLGLLIVFAYGGAPFRTTGGKMATLSLMLVGVAAYRNRQAFTRGAA